MSEAFTCPSCKAYIQDTLLRYFWEEAIYEDYGGDEFDYECPKCGVFLIVTNEPDPMLYCSLGSDE